MSRPAFAALPPRSEWFNLLLLTGVFAASFGICYGGAAALAPHIPWRIAVELPVDLVFPFWPGASALYLTILPVMLLAPFVLRDLASLLPLFAAFMFETAVGAALFILLPIDDAPVTCEAATLSCGVFNVADTINLHYNNLPSLHVAFACTMALALARRASPWGAVLLHAWAFAVALSTLFTRQHFFLDVLAGIALAGIAWTLAGGWARHPGVIAAFDVEILALRNMGRFVLRHRRYLLIAIAILSAGIPRWRRQRLGRVGFAFLQSLDDLLDGDRPSEREPLEIADEMLASLDSGHFAGHELARLGAVFRAELLTKGGPAALGTAMALIRAMRNDRRRVLARETSSREQLRDIHRITFSGSVDLMMLAVGSTLSHKKIPRFIDALGWCSAVRDLREDLGQGLINLPAEVFAAAAAEKPGMPLPVLVETSPVKQWLDEERIRGRELLDAADAELASLGKVRGSRVLKRFARSMRRFT